MSGISGKKANLILLRTLYSEKTLASATTPPSATAGLKKNWGGGCLSRVSLVPYTIGISYGRTCRPVI